MSMYLKLKKTVKANKGLIASSVFAGSAATLVNTGLVVSALPFMAAFPPAAAAAVIGVAAVLAFSLLYTVVRKIKAKLDMKRPKPLFSAGNLLKIAVIAASVAALVVAAPQLLLLAGASIPAVALFAHPAMQFFLPALLMISAVKVLPSLASTVLEYLKAGYAKVFESSNAKQRVASSSEPTKMAQDQDLDSQQRVASKQEIEEMARQLDSKRKELMESASRNVSGQSASGGSSGSEGETTPPRTKL